MDHYDLLIYGEKLEIQQFFIDYIIECHYLIIYIDWGMLFSFLDDESAIDYLNKLLLKIRTTKELFETNTDWIDSLLLEFENEYNYSFNIENFF